MIRTLSVCVATLLLAGCQTTTYVENPSYYQQNRHRFVDVGPPYYTPNRAIASPVVHCHMLYRPGYRPERVCRRVY